MNYFLKFGFYDVRGRRKRIKREREEREKERRKMILHQEILVLYGRAQK